MKIPGPIVSRLAKDAYICRTPVVQGGDNFFNMR